VDRARVAVGADAVMDVESAHGEVVPVAHLKLGQRARHRQWKRLHLAHLWTGNSKTDVRLWVNS